jgi:DNA-binding NtrC family response regulator
MPLPIQAKLLRVLETGRILSLGAREELAVNVRVLVSSNQNLETNIAQGRFRADLYYRLATYTVTVPPLRERQDDIPLLARHFLKLFAQEMNRPLPTLTPDAVERLRGYAFPGNVRELKNLMERALLLCTGSEILPEHLQIGTAVISPDAASSIAPVNSSSASPSAIDLPFNLAHAEVALIRRALAHTSGNVAAAARLLGIARNKVYRVLGKYPQP